MSEVQSAPAAAPVPVVKDSVGKRFSKYFVRGIFTFLPFGLTVVLLTSFLQWTEDISQSVFGGAGDFYFPGLGLIVGIFLICALGFLTTLKFFDKVVAAFELPFKNVPIIKSIYSAVKSLSEYFSPNADKSSQQVVAVKLPGTEIEVIGLVTRRHLADLPHGISKEDRVAVYVPLSYMVGGLTIFVQRSQVKLVDMPVEAAMRSALTAWMPSRE